MYFIFLISESECNLVKTVFIDDKFIDDSNNKHIDLAWFAI